MQTHSTCWIHDIPPLPLGDACVRRFVSALEYKDETCTEASVDIKIGMERAHDGSQHTGTMLSCKNEVSSP